MSCPELPIEDLVAHLDGELPEADSARVQTHLDAHETCRVEADQLRRTGELLATLPGLAPSAGFAERAVGAASARAPTGGRLLRLSTLRIVAAAAALVAVGGWWVLQGDRAPGGDGLPDAPAGDTLTASEEREIAEDLLVLTSLDLLETADTEELESLVDDLDVLDWVAAVEEGG